MKRSFNKKAGLLLMACLVLLLSACATSPAKPKTSVIEQRATERWSKMLSGDVAGAYEYLSPGFRSGVSSIQYQRAILLKRVRWTGAKYKGSDCTENTCSVRFLLSFTVAGALPGVKSFDGEKDIDESWILSDGVWYLVP